MCDSVSIQLFVLGKSPVSIQVPKHTQVSDLMQFVHPIQECSFVYSGNVMQRGFSLDFYGVRDEDMIIAILGSIDTPKKKAIWSQLTNDFENFSEKLLTIVKPELKKEISRLQDLRLSIQEGNNPRFYKNFSSVQKQICHQSQKQIQKTDTKYTKPGKPCTESLPRFWK